MPKNAKHERKNLKYPTYILNIHEDDNEGMIEHIISVMGILDFHDDIIKTGSYSKTISENKRIKVLDNHRTDSATRITGRPLSLREIGKNELPRQLLRDYPDATGALVAETKFNLNTQLGKDTFELVKAGDITDYSVGIILEKFGFEEMTMPNGHTKQVRIITEVKLLEYSTVIWGANPATQTLAEQIGEPDIEFSYAVPKTYSDSDEKDKTESAKATGETSDSIDSEVPIDTELTHNILRVASQTLLLNNEVDAARRLEKTLANVFTDRQIKQLSLRQREQLVRFSFYRQVDTVLEGDWWVIDVFDDSLTVHDWFDTKVGRVFSLDYEADLDQSIVTFAPFEEWREGRYEFVETSPTSDETNLSADSEAEPSTNGTSLTSTLDDDLDTRREEGLERLKQLQTVLNN